MHTSALVPLVKYIKYFTGIIKFFIYRNTTYIVVNSWRKKIEFEALEGPPYIEVHGVGVKTWRSGRTNR